MKITGPKEGIQVCFLWNPGSGKQTKGWISNNDVLSVCERERDICTKSTNELKREQESEDRRRQYICEEKWYQNVKQWDKVWTRGETNVWVSSWVWIYTNRLLC